MSEDMVERVAKAIGDTKAGIMMPWDFMPQQHKRQCRIEASAAIEAMREPTPHMLAETLPMTGVHCDPKTTRLAEMALHRLEPDGFPPSRHANGLDAALTLISDWYSMIDAALSHQEKWE